MVHPSDSSNAMRIKAVIDRCDKRTEYDGHARIQRRARRPAYAAFGQIRPDFGSRKAEAERGYGSERND
ncbi:MAG TPA: hypothetical protein DIT28_12900 [Oxalobacteraceae bacterium]|nr:hypothetical protein [Oxalobacteraceae bacterium]